jgi:hypothetical protein
MYGARKFGIAGVVVAVTVVGGLRGGSAQPVAPTENKGIDLPGFFGPLMT